MRHSQDGATTHASNFDRHGGKIRSEHRHKFWEAFEKAIGSGVENGDVLKNEMERGQIADSAR
jgi:hypothetical protein